MHVIRGILFLSYIDSSKQSADSGNSRPAWIIPGGSRFRQFHKTGIEFTLELMIGAIAAILQVWLGYIITEALLMLALERFISNNRMLRCLSPVSS